VLSGDEDWVWAKPADYQKVVQRIYHGPAQEMFARAAPGYTVPRLPQFAKALKFFF
jgi:hypothetical protein